MNSVLNKFFLLFSFFRNSNFFIASNDGVSEEEEGIKGEENQSTGCQHNPKFKSFTVLRLF